VAPREDDGGYDAAELAQPAFLRTERPGAMKRLSQMFSRDNLEVPTFLRQRVR